jgi:protein gp37
MSNPIGWCDLTLNPITGCLNNCPYCYARKMAFRLKGRYGYPEDEPFRPTFHPEVIQKIKNLKGSGKRIFLDSMSDWFGPEVKPEWIKQSIDAVASKPEHTFLVLTKRPDNMEVLRDMDIPMNLWFGVSVTNQEGAWRLEELMNFSPLQVNQHLFVSFEPLHGPIKTGLHGLHWVIIGAESGNRTGKVITENEWAYRLVESARNLEIPVFVKDNLVKAKIHSKEFPEEMQ